MRSQKYTNIHIIQNDTTTQNKQNQLQEAAQCVQDCQECMMQHENTDPDELRAEIAAAENSVDVAVACLVDLLDELRVSETEVATDQVVKSIKRLRADLVELKTKNDSAEERQN